jgi:hypothetical protein
VNTRNTGALWSLALTCSFAASAMARRPRSICDEIEELGFDSDSEAQYTTGKSEN